MCNIVGVTQSEAKVVVTQSATFVTQSEQSWIQIICGTILDSFVQHLSLNNTKYKHKIQHLAEYEIKLRIT